MPIPRKLTEKQKDGQKDEQNDGRKDGQTLFYRTLPANKPLTVAPNNENKEINNKNKEMRSKIKDLIRSINENSDNYNRSKKSVTTYAFVC